MLSCTSSRGHCPIVIRSEIQVFLFLDNKEICNIHCRFIDSELPEGQEEQAEFATKLKKIFDIII